MWKYFQTVCGVPKVLGRCHLWILRSSLGRCFFCCTRCDRCCRALHESVHLWLVLGHTNPPPPPPLHSCYKPCCFLIPSWFHLPLLQILPYLSPPPLIAHSSLLFLPPVVSLPLFLLLLLVSRPPSTSFVEFRQAIYIFLPGCLTSHSLNKVGFYCFCACVCSLGQCVEVSVNVSQSIGVFVVWTLVVVCMVLWVCIGLLYTSVNSKLFMFTMTCFFFCSFVWVCVCVPKGGSLILGSSELTNQTREIISH